MVVDLPLSSSGQEKGRLGVRLGVFCVRTYRYYRRKGFVTAESRTGVGGGILGKMRPMRPIWAICTKSGQNCPRIGGGEFNHMLQDISILPLLRCIGVHALGKLSL